MELSVDQLNKCRQFVLANPDMSLAECLAGYRAETYVTDTTKNVWNITNLLWILLILVVCYGIYLLYTRSRRV